MKVGSFLLFILASMAQAHAASLCDEGRAQLGSGQKYISCDLVDFQKKAVSADYQSKQTAPLMAKPSQIRDTNTNEQVYRNEYPGIMNTNAFFDADITLMNKFYDYIKVQSDQSSNPSNNTFHDTTDYLASAPFFNQMKSTATDGQRQSIGWEGKCELWSSWSLDPSVSSALSRIRDGILCSNIPFTKGEIKELITAFYPLPEFIDREHLNNFYDPRPANYDADRDQNVRSDIKREDANVALTKLGELGGGSRFTPASLMTLAKDAKNQGQNIVFGIDPGNEVWNQPMEAIADLTYSDSEQDPSAGSQSSDFASTNQDPNGSVRRGIAALEADLKSAALQGCNDYNFPRACGSTSSPNGSNINLGTELCRLKKAVGQDCTDLSNPDGSWKQAPSLSDLVTQLWMMENTAVSRGMLVNNAPPAEHHKILIRYGVEGSFAQTKQTTSQTRTLEYAKVGDRTTWSPPVKMLSDACDNGAGDRNQGHNSLIGNLDQQCQLLKSGKIQDHQVFAGALPPNEFKTFVAQANFKPDADSQSKKKAYDQLMDMLRSCDSFDRGATFLNDLKNTVATNQVSDADIVRLKNEYKQASGLLDQAYVQNYLQDMVKTAGSSGSSVAGLSQLNKTLFP